MSKRIVVVLLCCLVIIVALVLFRRPSTKPQSSPQPAPPQQEEKTTQVPVKPPDAQAAATQDEARAVVERIYKDAAVVDASRESSFTVGDFNGDDSQDIAIIIKPAKGKLPLINAEYANWIVQDPRATPSLDPDKTVQAALKKPAPVKIRPDDSLLTIIHGYQQAGWRNPAAMQTFLLKNSAGADLKAERVLDTIKRAQKGERLPGLRGDVILETLSVGPGFIYWTGTRYSWQKLSAQ